MAHPLMCWDIVVEGLSRRTEFEYDILTLKKIAKTKDWKFLERSLDNCIVWENKTIIVTNPDLVIIHATKNMYAMNGYLPAEVIGKTPKIFQGSKTEISEKQKIQNAISQQMPFESIITNYKNDGSIYKCQIEGCPVFNKAGHLVNFIALENAS